MPRAAEITKDVIEVVHDPQFDPMVFQQQMTLLGPVPRHYCGRGPLVQVIRGPVMQEPIASRVVAAGWDIDFVVLRLPKLTSTLCFGRCVYCAVCSQICPLSWIC
jgi:hypothetical protein